MLKSSGSILPIFIFLLIACNGKTKDTPLESAFFKWAERTDPIVLDSFKSCDIDSTGDCLDIFAPIVDSFYFDILNTVELNKYVDSVYTCNAKDKKIFLGVALHAYLNNQDILSRDFVYRKATAIIDYQYEIQSKLDEKENEQMAREAYEEIHVGDSFPLLLAVENNYGRKSIFFRCYPYTKDYSIADDSLSLTVVLQDKFYGKLTDGSTDSSCLAFRVKIIETSDTTVFYYSSGSEEKYIVGNEFDICLQMYGRYIKH